MFRDIKARLPEPAVGRIIALAAFDGTPGGVQNEGLKYLGSDRLQFYGWVEGGQVLGICGFEAQTEQVEIHLIAVDKEHHKQGIGGKMIAALRQACPLSILAETDDDAVNFYRKIGFEVTGFQHPRWGMRYTCILKM